MPSAENRRRGVAVRHSSQLAWFSANSNPSRPRSDLKPATCDWIRSKRNLLVTGPCGVGKSYLACALGHRACREDLSVIYHRVPRLFAALALGRADGRYPKMLRALRAPIC